MANQAVWLMPASNEFICGQEKTRGGVTRARRLLNNSMRYLGGANDLAAFSLLFAAQVASGAISSAGCGGSFFTERRRYGRTPWSIALGRATNSVLVQAYSFTSAPIAGAS